MTAAYAPVPKNDLSRRLTRVLDQLETVTKNINAVEDELMIQYLIENGDIDPKKITDFIKRKGV